MRRALVTVLLAAALGPVAALAADGDLDTGFDQDGTTTIGLGGDDAASGAAVQPDGKLVVAGSSDAGTTGTDFAVLRLNPDGTPDTTFSGDGSTVVDFGGDDTARAVALLPDGGIAVVGFTDLGGTAADPQDFAVALLEPDGTADGSFSGDGRQTVDFGHDDRAHGVAIDADGQILVAGTHDDGSPAFAFARLTPGGALDVGFGDVGRKEVVFVGPAELDSVALTPTGGIVAAGSMTDATPAADMVVARLEGDGDQDTAFSGDGRAVIDFGGDDRAAGVAARRDGSVVVAGTSTTGSGGVVLASLEPDGDLDVNFGDLGRQTVTFGSSATGSDEAASDVAVTSTGRIAVAGRADSGNDPDQFAVALLGRDGAPSAGFSANGKRTVDFGGDDETVAVVPRGNRIYLAGTTGASPDRDFAVAVLEGGGPRVAIRDAAAFETSGLVNVPVNLTAASNVPVTVRVTTIAGTARAGRDFVPVDTTLTFPVGTTAARATVTLVDDSTVEPVETFVVALSEPGEAGLGRDAATIRISSNERDRRAPVLSRVRVRPKTFRAARGGRVSYRLSERASVLLAFQVKRRGRWQPFVARRLSGRAGANALRMRRRIAGRRLRAGRYRVVLRASDIARNQSKRVRRTFTVRG
jgi:uncharacterized delta-60 repeat protein